MHGVASGETLDGCRSSVCPFNTDGWQAFGLVGAGMDVFGCLLRRKLDAAAAGILGTPGLAAYAGSALCGMISQYGNGAERADSAFRHVGEVWAETGKRFFECRQEAARRLFAPDFVGHCQESFLVETTGWIQDGRVQVSGERPGGLDQAPAAFRAMLAGGNLG